MGGRQRSEYRQENKEIERIDAEIKRLNELGKVKKKVEAGEYKNTETAATLKPLEIEHEKRMLLIKENRERKIRRKPSIFLKGRRKTFAITGNVLTPSRSWKQNAGPKEEVTR